MARMGQERRTSALYGCFIGRGVSWYLSEADTGKSPHLKNCRTSAGGLNHLDRFAGTQNQKHYLSAGERIFRSKAATPNPLFQALR